MECFSLRLIENQVVREWLMGRNEVYIPPHIVESSVGICGDTKFGNENERLHFLMRPVGVVDNILIGLKLGGTFQFALPKNFSGVATSKRFVVDLKSFEKLEFHWFSNNTVLVDWMKFPTNQYRIRYLVLFEAPPLGKLPSKLLRSSEIISTREEVMQEKVAICGPDGEPHLLNEDAFVLCNYERDVFLDAIHYMMRSLGVFSGSLRITDYQRNYEQIVPIRTAIHVIRSQKTEHLKMAEMMNYSVHSPLANNALKNFIIFPTGKLKRILEKEHFMDEYRRYEPYALMAYVRRQHRRQRRCEKRKNALSSSSANDSRCSSTCSDKVENKHIEGNKMDKFPSALIVRNRVPENVESGKYFSEQNVSLCTYGQELSCTNEKQKSDETNPFEEKHFNWNYSSSLSTYDISLCEPTCFIDELYDMFQERDSSYELDDAELLESFM